MNKTLLLVEAAESCSWLSKVIDEILCNKKQTTNYKHFQCSIFCKCLLATGQKNKKERGDWWSLSFSFKSHKGNLSQKSLETTG